MSIPPGSANKTTRFPAKRSRVVTSFHLNGFSPPSFASRTLALKTTFGTVAPSLKGLVDSIRAALEQTGKESKRLFIIFFFSSVLRNG